MGTRRGNVKGARRIQKSRGSPGASAATSRRARCTAPPAPVRTDAAVLCEC